MRSKLVFLTLVLFACSGASATAEPGARAPCTVQPRKGTPKGDLAGMTRVTQADARKAALASVKADKAEVAEAELELERGCLVYSFDIKIPGKSGVQEVQVDAGNGKVLSSKHESLEAEAKEKAGDKAKEMGKAPK